MSVLLSHYLCLKENQSGHLKSITRTRHYYLVGLWLFGLLSTSKTTSVINFFIISGNVQGETEHVPPTKLLLLKYYELFYTHY